MMKIVWIVSKVMMGVLVFAVVLGALFIGLPELAGAKALVVISPSMEPDIGVGSLVVSFPCAKNELEIGDDISYYIGESDVIVTHRIVDINEKNDTVTTRGLSNETDDAPVPVSDVVGKVKYTIPKIGYFLNYFATARGKILTILGIAAMIMFTIMVDEYYMNSPKKREKVHLTNLTATGNNT